ncbi:MAG: SDR family oxidoreductase [Pseudomonadota bacterium]
MGHDLNLSGKVALVAGGSSGIGLGIAHALLQAGAVVHITGTKPNAIDYRDDLDREGLIFHCLNVKDDRAATDLAGAFEALDILVCSVGTVAYGKAEFETDIFRDVLNVNLVGVMHLCTQFKDALSNSKFPVILLLGSTSSFIATPAQPAYSASKGGLRTLTKSLAHAWAKDGIRVNALAPGFVETKLTKRSRDNDKAYEASIDRIPMKRWGTTEEMGNAALFLVSSMSTYVTGQMLLVDGGLTLM